MNNVFEYFSKLPGSVKWALFFVHVSWVFFIISLYAIYLPGYSVLRFVIMGLACCYMVTKFYSWGRMLALLGNAMILLYCIFFSLIFFGKDQVLFFTSIGNVILFSLASYFLWTEETAFFFKTYRASKEKARDDGKG